MSLDERKLSALTQSFIDFSWQFTKGYLGPKMTSKEWAEKALRDLEQIEREAEFAC